MYIPTKSCINVVSVILILQVLTLSINVFGLVDWGIIWIIAPLWLPWVLLAFSVCYIKLFAILLYGLHPENNFIK